MKPKRQVWPISVTRAVKVYDADEMDAWLRDEVLRDLRMHLRLQDRYGIKSRRTRALIAQLEEADDG